MPDKMPEDMPDKMPEDLPVTKRIDVMVGITRSKVISLFNSIVSQALTSSLSSVPMFPFCLPLKTMVAFASRNFLLLDFSSRSF